jgi:hypothetical protein
MGTLTQGIFERQKAVDWFSNLTEEQRNNKLKEYNINKVVGIDLLNEDIFKLYKLEHGV